MRLNFKIKSKKMNYIVFDLEATCWKERNEKQNEIIEIGAVCLDENLTILDEYCSFVCPKLNPILSDFCTELTSIQTTDIAAAPLFPEAVDLFQKWINSFGKNYWLCSWGFYDRSQLKKDCNLHQLPTHWLKKHISVKHQYAKIKQLNRPIGMATALAKEGFELEGTLHRGIDDAKNIAKIFKANFEDFKFKS